MGRAIGEVLILAIGVAISVVPIIAIILLLITPSCRLRRRGRRLSPRIAGCGILVTGYKGWRVFVVRAIR